MSTILHMSDFHFGKNITVERKRLDDLATWIKESELKIDYLVFTGDIIDAPVVQTDCVKKLKKQFPDAPDAIKSIKPSDDPDSIRASICAAGSDYISAYNDLLRDITKKHMKQAGEFFLSFIRRIDIDKRDVILCCGNHDRLRFADEPVFECKDTRHFDESVMEEQFAAYDDLCRSINDELSHRTMRYPRKGVNFIIANSNWKTPSQKETNNMCISCDSLSAELSQLRHSEMFNRNCNLLIAHKPYDDFCESVKYPYDGELLTVQQIIERSVTAFLYGDKHSYAIRMRNDPKEFMCGLPLNYKGIRYNLLDTDPVTGVRACSYIINDGNGWINVPITDCIESVYNTSKQFLKSYAFTLLTKSSTIPLEWDSMIESFQNVYENGTLSQISELFASFSDLRKDRNIIDINESTFFDQLFYLIDGCSSQSVSIKGRPGTGKSTFMTIMYLHMLWMFSNGKSRYIPFYFSVETITTNLPEDILLSHDENNYILYVVEQFSHYLDSCVKLHKDYHLPLCLFIDGLEKSNSLAPGDNTIEKRIYQLVESKLDKNEDRYVMSFNAHDSYHFDKSFDKINRFEYVLFINRVRIFSYKPKERKQDTFLSRYLSLHSIVSGDETLQSIKNNLVKFRRPSIDLFFLHHFEKHIFDITEHDSIWDVLKEHLRNLEEITDRIFGFRIDTAMETAGTLFSQRKRYSQIIEIIKSDCPTVTEFLSIINTPAIEDYLIARYYIHALSDYSNTEREIPDDSILFSFVPNEISIIIRLLLDEKGEAANEILSRFIDLHSKQLSGFLYSMISYLCGHLRTEGSSDLIDKIPAPNRESQDFFSLCSRRSYDLAKAVCSTDKFPTQKIVLELIENEGYRRFNRSYQVHYYQDVSNNAIRNQFAWNPNKAPSIGFDFRYSFLMLLSKLEPALKETRPYPLMELDLFTLCDLIYSRLQHTASDSLFYSAKYNEKDDSECESILNKTISLLATYNKLYGGNRSGNERIGAFFSLMGSRLTDVQKNVEINIGKDVSIPYVSPCYDFDRVLKLSSLARVGWNINTSGTIKVDSQPSYTIDPDSGKVVPTIYESLMQHIMESVYIAQLFLPSTLPEEGFEKSKVIDLLLLSELGKTFSGDYSPYYSNHQRLRNLEKEGLANILTLGSLDGYATQSVFFRPFPDMTAADINMRICWEIKMIQMEYKYYTLYHQLGFDDERRDEFENDFEEPTTNVCKKIREQLILNNPHFKGSLIK